MRIPGSKRGICLIGVGSARAPGIGGKIHLPVRVIVYTIIASGRR